jgi:hypothetical protein
MEKKKDKLHNVIQQCLTMQSKVQVYFKEIIFNLLSSSSFVSYACNPTFLVSRDMEDRSLRLV